jgi:ubiquinone/menaquinone biosynthesis C-methylase UbiE
MPTANSKTVSVERLRASPNFALAHTLDGRPYVAKESEPYIQFWLSERYRIVLSMFSGRHGATLPGAIEAALRLTRPADPAAERKRLLKAVADMRSAGVLVDTRDDTSRYDARIVEAYVAHRPFPRELSDLIIREGAIGPASRVLDLAGGPGDLALALAQASNDVSLMELSRGFLGAARARARQLGLNLTPLHESCNRLVFQNDEYDAITVSQALHWLDDVQVCRGVCRVLRPGGSFFVVHSAIDIEDSHPLAYVFGHDSVLGQKRRQSFADEVEPLLRRLTLLFGALDAPEVDRIDLSQQGVAATGASAARIVQAGVSIAHQRRPIGPGFARAFLTERHIQHTGQPLAAFWSELEARCASAPAALLEGSMHWAVLHFARGAKRAASASVAAQPVMELTFAA